MNFFSASSSSRRNVHIAIRIFAVVLAPFVSLNLLDIVYALAAYLFYYTIGHGIMLHRYYSHRAFEFKHTFVKWCFNLITISSIRGDPIGWAYLHKLHHANVDSENDPHSPHYQKFNIFSIGNYDHLTNNINPVTIRHLLTKETLFINKYYWLLALPIPLLLMFINVHLFYVYWLLPICLFELMSNVFNYLNHMKTIGSYKNYETQATGHSVNNLFLWPFSLGEAWHNNHHQDPKNFNFKKTWWEFDLSASIIKFVKK